MDPLSALVEVKVESWIFSKYIVAMPKSIKYAVISSPRSTLFGFRSQWITCMKQWWWRYVMPCAMSIEIFNLWIKLKQLATLSLEYNHFSRLPFDMNGNNKALIWWYEQELMILIRLWFLTLLNTLHSLSKTLVGLFIFYI